MGSTRIKGTQLRMLVTPPDQSEPVDYWADATKVILDNESETEIDVYGTPHARSVRWHLSVSAIQSTDSGSLWTFLFEHMNQAVPFVYAPHGNAIPTEAQPHFTGTAVVPAPPPLGGEAGEDVVYVFDTQLPIIEGPERVTS